jgi:hypothetical protein
MTHELTDRLHAAILNLPWDVNLASQRFANFEDAYASGHGDARHAAAELVLAHLAQRGTSEAVKLLERIEQNPENMTHNTLLRQDVRRFLSGLAASPQAQPMPEGGAGYMAAFYEMAATLGVDVAQAKSPQHVYTEQVKPAVEKLIANRCDHTRFCADWPNCNPPCHIATRRVAACGCDSRASAWGVVRPSSFHYEGCPLREASCPGQFCDCGKGCLTHETKEG